MTVFALHCQVTADEYKLRAVVIEALGLLPVFEGMAGFAIGGLPILIKGNLPVVEFALMGVLVTGSAAHVLEDELQGIFRLGKTLQGMTGRALDLGMSAEQRIARSLVVFDRVLGRLESSHVVTNLAAVQVGCILELAAMLVFVAVGTLIVLKPVHGWIRGYGDDGGWNVTLLAFDRGVLALQRIFCFGMIADHEFSGLEALFVVARRTLSAVTATRKLRAMRTGVVTVAAVLEGDLLREASSLVTFFAIEGGVLAEQRELGGAVIEMATDAGHDQLEAVGVVAGSTGFIAEGGTMRALVAVFAAIVLELNEAGLAVIAGGVTLHAIHLGVKSGERVAGLGVIESLHGFPFDRRVTLGAIAAELTLVHIFVAIDALAAQPQKRLADVLDLDGAAFFGGDLFWGVALVAGLLQVMSNQRPAGLGVIEEILRRLPLD